MRFSTSGTWFGGSVPGTTARRRASHRSRTRERAKSAASTSMLPSASGASIVCSWPRNLSNPERPRWMRTRLAWRSTARTWGSAAPGSAQAWSRAAMSAARRAESAGISGRPRMSIRRQRRVHLPGPGQDPTPEVLEAAEARLAQGGDRLGRAPAGTAVHDVGPGRIELVEPLGKGAERDEPRALDVGDRPLVGLAHVHERQVLPRLEPPLELARRDLVPSRTPRLLPVAEPAEGLVVLQLVDRRRFAAERAIRVAPQTQLLEPHAQRVVEQQPPGERLPDAEQDLDRLRRLDDTDDARQHPQHATLGAARHEPRGRGLGIEAAVAGPAVRPEDARLPLEAVD